MNKDLITVKKERDLTIDLIKGIGIILMVIRHARAPYSDIILLFHMAIFFIASGYLYNGSKIKDLKSLRTFIIKKIKGLWLPQFIFSTIFVMFNNIFIQLNIYTDKPEFLLVDGPEVTYRRLAAHYDIIEMLKQIVKAVFFQCTTQVGGAFWFFQTLFIVLIMYATVDLILNRLGNENMRRIIKGIFGIIFLLIGYYCCLNGLMLKGLSRVFSVYILIYMGENLRDISRRITGIESSVYKEILSVVLAAGMLLIAQNYGNIDLSSNSIENPIFFLTVSLLGWFLLYGISMLLLRTKCISINVISYISVHSVPIIALHFLCFKLINVIAVFVTGQEKYMIASFPVLMYSGLWWLAYTVVGICIPLALNFVFWQGIKTLKSLLINGGGRA